MNQRPVPGDLVRISSPRDVYSAVDVERNEFVTITADDVGLYISAKPHLAKPFSYSSSRREEDAALVKGRYLAFDCGVLEKIDV